MIRVEFFGEPWDSGVCEDGQQAPTPLGVPCLLCEEPVRAGDQGGFMFGLDGNRWPTHRECSLREVLGGIGHLSNHERWCVALGDPDGGRTRRQSALEVWDWITRRGLPER